MTAKEYLNKFGLDADPALFTNVHNGRQMKPKYNSYCFYDGPSQLGRKFPIIAVMSNCQYNAEDYNIKTGDMLQTYIIMRWTHPQDAIDIGLDRCICGKCPHMRNWKTHIVNGKTKIVRTCYVNIGKGVASIYESFH